MASSCVYVLGAGFSHHAGMPLVGGLREDVFRWLGLNGCSDPKIQRHLNPGPDWPLGKFAAGLSLVNSGQGFEEMLIDLRVKARVQEHWVAVHSIRVLERACVRWLWEKQNKCSICNSYLNFARRLKHESLGGVITFNWDLICEKALSSAGYEWSYQRNSRFAVIKPHGSINWVNHLQSKDGTIIKNPEGFSPIDDGLTISWRPNEPFVDPLLPGDSDELRQMLFPGSPELPDQENVAVWNDAKSLWDDAEILISDATAVVFIGYSMPSYDSYARQWFQDRCSGKKITVCNPSPAVIQTFQQTFGHENVLVCPSRFEESSYSR